MEEGTKPWKWSPRRAVGEKSPTTLIMGKVQYGPENARRITDLESEIKPLRYRKGKALTRNIENLGRKKVSKGNTAKCNIQEWVPFNIKKSRK